MITYCSTSTEEELHQILELQKRNLLNDLSSEEKEGFVTVQHTFSVLKEMHDKVPHTIAKDGDKVVGYALSMHPDFAQTIPLLKPMFDEIEKSSASQSNFITMGQVCVDKNYRKQGIFRGLYSAMQNMLKGQFDTIITEIDTNNTRSLNAHAAIGFKDLSEYYFEGQDWKVVILDV